MSLVASERPKRSISSTIKDFIWGKPSNRQFPAFPKRSKQEKPSQDDVSKNVGPIASSEPKEDIPGLVFLYEGDSQVRPPVLPILPVQRLRLLRQKQEWRKRHDLNSLYLLPSDVASSSPSNPDIPNVPYKSSSTPSPMKMNHAVAPPLKRKRTKNNRSRGTKWSGEFEYDLAEYDTVEKPATPQVQDELSFGQVSAQKTAVGPLKSSLMDQDVNSNQLSSTQRRVLLSGPQSILQKGPNDKDTSKNVEKTVKKDEKVILPSVGFDFIKSSDTPSKVKTQQRDDEDEAEPRRKRQIIEPSKPSFQFSAGPAEERNENPKPSFSFGTKKDDNEPAKPSFSFGAKKDDNEPAKPSFSFGAKKDDNEPAKPSFSFGAKKDDNEPAKPSFSFGAKKDDNEPAKPSFSFGAKKDDNEPAKPSFSFGAKKDDNEPAKPSFSFGAKKDDNEPAKPSFSFGAKKDDNEPAKPSFSFGAKKDDNEPTKPSFSFGAKKDDNEPAKPSFSFGAKKDDNEPAKPSFSFGTKKDDNEPAKPSFSFGAKKDDNEPAKPSFSFGAKKDDNEPAKSSFSFGAKKDDNEPAKSSFSFGAKKDDNEPAKPSFSLGAKDADKSKSSANLGVGSTSTPSFNFGPKKDESTEKSTAAFSFGVGASEKPSFTFGANANDPAKGKMPFSFGARPDEPKEEGKTGPKPTFSFGGGANAPSNPALSFGTNKEGTTFDKTSQPFTQDVSKQENKSNGFSFNRLNHGAQQPTLEASAPVAASSGPTFNFGAAHVGANTGVNDKPPASNGPSVFAPTPQTAEKPFSFSRPNSNPSLPSQPGSATNDNASSFNFKFGAGPSVPAAQPPAPINPLGNNPFVSKPSGFGFGGNGAGPFGASQAPTPSPGAPASAFANTSSISPAFGKSVSPPAGQNFDSTTRTFTPSNSINLNFGGSGASADPSRIFSGGSTNSQLMPGMAPTPQQVFGGPQSPAPMFGGGQALPVNGAGFGGAASGMPQNPPQPAMPNFQLPPGRKLARMRQSRRA